ncbi:MAG: RagB/SusD family nutrient uptake outer membrane protein [Cryomorphaceae bacterium]
MPNRNFKLSVLFALLIAFTTTSCEDILEQQPPDAGDNVLPSEAVRTFSDLEEVLISAYDVLANTYNGSIQNLPSVIIDDLDRPFNQDNYSEIWLRSTNIFNGSVGGAFFNSYIAILRSNTVIENLDNVPGDNSEKLRVEAEARFIRALCHFDLVRLFAQPYGFTPDNGHAGIAVRTTTDVENAPRNSVAQVYNFVLADLQFAKEHLSENTDVYASANAARALEALVRFQRHEYDLAYSLSNEVINSGQTSFDDNNVNMFTFPQVSPEAIFYIFSFEFSPGNVDSRNGAFRGNYLSEGANVTLRLSQDFYEGATATSASAPRAELFEEREVDGNLFFVTNKFDAEFFHIPVISHTQMMLIRAESAGELNLGIDEAIADINRIRERAYGGIINNLPNSANAQAVIDAARMESRYELAFTGQRFHDLKRRGAQGEDIVVRGAPWDCPGMVLQFPSTEETDLFPLNPAGGC